MVVDAADIGGGEWVAICICELCHNYFETGEFETHQNTRICAKCDDKLFAALDECRDEDEDLPF